MSLESPTGQPGFQTLKLEVRQADTAILLLGSAERPVLLAAAAGLADYAARDPGNLDRLFDLQLVDGLLPLIHHEDVFTRRFALKLLALMSAVRNVQDHLLADGKCIQSFTEMLAAEESDLFVREFASRILAELTSNLVGSASFLDSCRDASLLFQQLNSSDPDVKKNCVEIIDNLLGDFDGLEVVCSSKAFSFEAIYALLQEPYPVIQQLALDVVERLVMHSSHSSVQEAFRGSGSPRYLLDVLENGEWEDLHGKVIRVLSLACENEKTAEVMNSTDGTRRLYNFMEIAADDERKFEVLGILNRLAESVEGKKVLHAQGFVRFLLSHTETMLRHDIHAVICHGIAKMTQYVPAADELSEGNPIDFIIHLLNDDRAKWSERQAAAFGLKELLITDFQNCINFLDLGGQVHLTRIIQQPAQTVPWEIQITIIQAVSAVASHPRLLEDLAERDLLTALCSHLDPESEAADELRIACCCCLGRLGVGAEARRLLMRAGLPCKLHCLLARPTTAPLLNAAVQLLLGLCADELFARLCAQEGCLFLMLKNRPASRAIPSWDACVEALFSADLSMKFAYTGRLSLRDITPDGFHAMRHSFCPFPTLDELFRLKLCPLQPIYVANFGETQPDDEIDYLSSKCAAFNAAREAMRRESRERGIRVSEATLSAWLELKFGRLQPDPELVASLERFKAELAAAEGSQDGALESSPAPGLFRSGLVASRARRLAVFVARRLSGVGPDCLDQQLELHLRALKCRLETSVIPLGLLRVGSYLERALLFKALADRLGLPASLVRGCDGKSWIEVAVPQVKPSGNDVCEGNGACQAGRDVLPVRYLRENFIVDLLDEPGELVRIGSWRAERYRERREACEFACCEGPARPGFTIGGGVG